MSFSSFMLYWRWIPSLFLVLPLEIPSLTLPLLTPNRDLFTELELSNYFVHFHPPHPPTFVGFFLSIFKHTRVSSVLVKILISFRLHLGFTSCRIGLTTYSFLIAPHPFDFCPSPSPCSPASPPFSPGIPPSHLCRLCTALQLNIGAA